MNFGENRVGTTAPNAQLIKVIRTSAPPAPRNTYILLYRIDIIAAKKNVFFSVKLTNMIYILRIKKKIFIIILIECTLSPISETNIEEYDAKKAETFPLGSFITI